MANVSQWQIVANRTRAKGKAQTETTAERDTKETEERGKGGNTLQ